MKAGALAFIALLTLLAAAMCRGMQLMMRLDGDRLKPVAFSLVAMVLMFVLFSYVDLGLVSPRALVFFGAVLGLIGALAGFVTREEGTAPTGASHGPASG
jgi:hypothetical protein